MSARSENLTPRQQEILDFIRNTLETECRPPTRAEVCTAFGFRSLTAADDHLRAGRALDLGTQAIRHVGQHKRGRRIQPARERIRGSITRPPDDPHRPAAG